MSDYERTPEDIAGIKKWVKIYEPQNPDEKYIVETIKEGISAFNNGNYGIGAVLVDNTNGDIVARGQNQVFSRRRSDLHAEMSTLNTAENSGIIGPGQDNSNYTLFTSLEPCTMCRTRIITSGIGAAVHAVNDEYACLPIDRMPPVWQDIARNNGTVFRTADVSPEVSSKSFDLFLLTKNICDNRLKSR